MNSFKSTSISRHFCKVALVALLAATSLAHATNTFWTGPTFTFNHASFTSTADKLTTNHVNADAVNNIWLTRGSSQPLYNAAAESAWNGSGPAHTLWVVASGDLTNAASLSYGSFAAVVGAPGNTPRQSINKTFFVKIVPDNIYLSLKLTAWGNNNGGSFSYDRSTPAVVVAPPTPTVTVTNPAGGTVFAAPANVNLGADAEVSSGTVTNVLFFTNGVAFKSVLTTPFTLTANNLAAGTYALKAAATAAGISATSAVVNIIVDAPPVVTITNPLNNTTLSAPANLNIQASASDSDGSVTNVQFLVGTGILTNKTSAPFAGITNNLAAGTYTLSAIAADNNGIRTTNAVSVTVVNPVTVSLGGPVKSSGTNFQFSFAANVGLTYVIERATDLALANWIRVATNIAASNPVVFLDSHATNIPAFYRVGRLPNP